MVATKIADLTEDELKFMEDLLLKEFSKETEKAKTWQTKNPQKFNQLRRYCPSLGCKGCNDFTSGRGKYRDRL